jgi:putative addiction module killer protein
LRYNEGGRESNDGKSQVETKPRTVSSLPVGNAFPFDTWLSGLKDANGKAQIEYRINKVRRGLIGEYDKVGDGILELILDNKGPGYRVYCVDDGKDVLLICGGDKGTQVADIKLARKLWTEYKASK